MHILETTLQKYDLETNPNPQGRDEGPETHCVRFTNEEGFQHLRLREIAIVERHPGNYQVLEGHDFCLCGQILRIGVRFIGWNEHSSHERRVAELLLHACALHNTLEYQLNFKTGQFHSNGLAS